MSETSSSRLNRFDLTFSGKERNQRASSSETGSSSNETRESFELCDLGFGSLEGRPADVEGRVDRSSTAETDENHEPSFPRCFVRLWAAAC